MPFVKGKSGNPNGRPKGSRNVSPIWKETGNIIDPETGKTQYQLLVELAYSKALGGDQRMIELVFERQEGKAAQVLTIVPEPPEYDMKLLTDDELDKLEAINKRLGVEEDDETITVEPDDNGGEVQT